MISEITFASPTRLCHSLPVIFLAAVMAFGGLGCSKESIAPEDPLPEQPVLMNIGSQAFSIGTADEQINSLRILLVAKNIYGTVVCNRFISNPSSTPLTVEVVGGKYDIYLIANEMPDYNPYTPLETVSNIKALRQIALPFAPDNRTFTNIPMFGSVENVTITPQPGPSQATNLATITVAGVDMGTELPVTLTRMACKVNLTLKRTRGTMKAVEFNHLPDAIPLFAETYITPGSHLLKAVAISEFTETSDPGATYPLIAEQKDILLPSWQFADKGQAANAIQLKVTITENNGAERTYSSAIGHAADKGDYTLWRNQNYTLTALVTNYIITTSAEVESWVDKTLGLEGGTPIVPPATP